MAILASTYIAEIRYAYSVVHKNAKALIAEVIWLFAKLIGT